MQAKPFWHGFVAQSSMLVSQESPENPETQRQVRPSVELVIPVKSVHCPPFKQGKGKKA